MEQKMIAVFDIGKTNKKLFLFDGNHKVIQHLSVFIEPIRDEDGFPCEDIQAVVKWMLDTLNDLLVKSHLDIKAINFCSYGASLIHLDQEGNILTPLYNYTKPLPDNLMAEFWNKYGPQDLFERTTASPYLGMLNAGMQLYWIKRRKPEIFKNIQYSLNLPQFLSYSLTGIPVNEYTSLGCHTALWDYEKNTYHRWVFEEEINTKFPQIVSSQNTHLILYRNRPLEAGNGIHDSSAALIPYLAQSEDPFLLLSTGTWSICMNPFNHEPLTHEELSNDCLLFMRTDGRPVKVSRLFLGNEYDLQVKRLCDNYDKQEGYDRSCKFDRILYQYQESERGRFKFESIPKQNNSENSWKEYLTFEEAYHQLMIELMRLQEAAIRHVIGTTSITRIFVDGGFVDNDLFIRLLENAFPQYEVKTSKRPAGSAIGAAMVLSGE